MGTEATWGLARARLEMAANLHRQSRSQVQQARVCLVCADAEPVGNGVTEALRAVEVVQLLELLLEDDAGDGYLAQLQEHLRTISERGGD